MFGDDFSAWDIAVNILLKIKRFRHIFVMVLFRKKNSGSLSQRNTSIK